eukprot:TRINITY_DN68099_c2_g4_i5.p1 TRINITY_DN68099_c2_g4~~TRINITY_DN68099_c2_g4_i5.p1  ORF type:complete len:252 (-),score=20.11 TRINITY_DN68099_c2_g4_i5:144-869(-)
MEATRTQNDLLWKLPPPPPLKHLAFVGAERNSEHFTSDCNWAKGQSKAKLQQQTRLQAVDSLAFLTSQPSSSSPSAAALAQFKDHTAQMKDDRCFLMTLNAHLPTEWNSQPATPQYMEDPQQQKWWCRVMNEDMNAEGPSAPLTQFERQVPNVHQNVWQWCKWKWWTVCNSLVSLLWPEDEVYDAVCSQMLQKQILETQTRLKEAQQQANHQQAKMLHEKLVELHKQAHFVPFTSQEFTKH